MPGADLEVILDSSSEGEVEVLDPMGGSTKWQVHLLGLLLKSLGVSDQDR